MEPHDLTSAPASAGNTPLVAVEWDAEGRVTRWPAGAEALFGWSAEEVVGKRSMEWPFVHPEDRAAVRERTVGLVRGTARQNLSVNRNLTRDGRVLHCEWYNTAVVDERGKLVAQLSLVLDVTARERAFEEMRAAHAAAERAAERTRGLQRVTAALSEALTPAEVMRVVVEQGLVLLGATAGLVMLLDETEQSLRMAEHRGYPAAVAAEWPRVALDAHVPLATAVRTGEPVALHTLEERNRLYPGLTTSVYPSILAVPIAVEGAVLGGLGLSFATEQELGEEEIELATALARQCAQAVRRATLYQREREARREVESLGERLRLALEAANVGTWDMDPRTLALRADERTCAILGLGAEPEYAAIRAVIHPDDRGAVRDAMARALDPAGTGEYTAEYRIQHPGGPPRWVLARGRGLFEGEGGERHATLLTGTLSDITGRVHAGMGVRLLAEAGTALAASSDADGVLRALARIAAARLAPACAVILAGGDGAPEKVRVALRADGEVQLRDADPALTPDGDARVSRLLDAAAAEPLDGSTHPLLSALFGDGAWGNAAAVPMRLDGRPVGVLVLARDAREPWAAEELAVAEELARRAARAVDRASLYERALAANLAKSQFLATMSHEIRTPINAIVGYAELLEMGVAGPLTEAQAGYLARVRDSSEHLLGLISDILDLAKVEAGEMRFAREPVPAAEAASTVVAMLLPQAEAKAVRLGGEPCAPGVEMLGDPNRIRQVLLNLVSNAVKFTRPGGRVAVRCGVASEAPAGVPLPGDGPWAFVEVADTGIGVPPDEIGRIFDPFTQVDSTHTRQEGGTGLGLAISRGFARRMGGDVTLWSRPDEGSVFTLWLPARAAAPASAAGALPPRPGEVPGLASVGRVLEERVEEVLTAWTRRIGEEPGLPHARGVEWIQLEDHAATFLVEVARSLMAMDAGGGEPALLRDGESIIRTVARLHGAQRARLGFTADELRLEYRILFEEAARLLRRHVSALTDADPGAALAVAQRVIESAAEVALDGYAVPTEADEAVAEAHRVIDRSRETVRRLRALSGGKKRKRGRARGAGEEDR